MMPVFDFSEYIIFCPTSKIHNLPDFVISDYKKTSHDKITLFSTDNMDENIHQELIRTKNIEIKRYLDKFYICLPIEINDRQILFDNFFDIIGRDFNSLVDVDRNSDNIRNLLSIISKNNTLSKKSIIVDYGCGTGISNKIAKEFDLTLCGVDRSIMMQQISNSRGMVMIDVKEFTLNPISIDGIISSYTLHLEPNVEELLLLSNKLQSGKSIVANFHKNRGIDFITDIFTPLNFDIKIHNIHSAYEHGDYYEFIKT